MRKEMIWKIGCILFLLLSTCTVLSARIENMMQIDVKTTRGIQGKNGNEETRVFPASAIIEREGITYVCAVRTVKGIFGGEKWQVLEKPVNLLEETQDEIEVNASEVRDEDLNPLDVIYYSSYPVKAGDQVTVTEEKKDIMTLHRRFVKQIGLLFVGAALFPVLLFCFGAILKKLQAFQDGKYGEAVKGMIFLTVLLTTIYGITGILRIPREFLPEEQIFDLTFYVERICHFFTCMGNGWENRVAYESMRTEYIRIIGIGSAAVLAFWLAMAEGRRFAVRKQRRRKQK
ncbi:hypothetical protein ABXS75_19535 [Roseburia hominis]